MGIEFQAAKTLFVEAVEKVWRLEHLVGEVRHSAGPQDQLLFELFDGQLAELWGSLEPMIGLLAGTDDGSPGFIRTIDNTVAEVLTKLSVLHIGLAYLPGRAVRPETGVFVSGVCNSAAPSGREPVIEPSVILALLDEYNFGEVDVPAWLRREYQRKNLRSPSLSGREAVVCVLPIIEGTNPLTWVLLVHELGHAVDGRHRLSEAVTKAISAPGPAAAVFNNWAKEFCADLIALRLVGPAYFAAYCSFCAFSRSLRYTSDTHPPSDLRIWMLKSTMEDTTGHGLALHDPFIDYYWNRISHRMVKEGSNFSVPGAQGTLFQDLGFDQWCPRCGNDRRIEVQVPMTVEALRKDIWERLDALAIPAYSDTGLARSRALSRGRLTDWVPIGSARRAEPASEAIAARIDGIQQIVSPSERKEAVYSLLSEAAEEPTSPADIVNAGWLHKAEERERRFDEVFSRPVSFQDNKKLYTRGMEVLDLVLMQSIASSGIHSMLRDLP